VRARRWWGWPLAPVYAAALAVKDALRALGVLKVRRLAWPVVSVGSLSAGGAGKTPVVIALAVLLKGRGWSVDVLSRGYGRESSAVSRVETERVGAAAEYGDEPVLIAQRAGVEVWVGADRFEAGHMAESFAAESGKQVLRFAQNDRQKSEEDDQQKGEEDDQQKGEEDDQQKGEEDDQQKGEEDNVNDRPKRANSFGARALHLLDDGFQHQRLARSVDVVLVTVEDLEDALLPAGNRREPLRALKRAGVVVVREVEFEGIVEQVRGLIGAGTPIWRIRRRLRFPAPLGVLSAGLRPVAFCAIARPEGFAEMLVEAGCGIVETVAFADHRALDNRDVDELLRVAAAVGATGFVTTEKDAVKLQAEARARLEAVGPVVVVALDVEFVDADAVMRDLEARLG
jgi:tetraacyldisaccharide 4'-kinase